ncbi:hypothetical protein fugu_015125 [Takifugu bimaculatus]|uniref:2',3'-cyclic-nucleotide 3'-phosphodiesterase n=1 Tax=Takifugu bimaculatus TaxID=433685 RepID=A0A4Z2BXW5_9TELE|nr:hypothetical protein fugu_015125 [Takifugu bimaculatus]
MDAEMSNEVSDASEPVQPEEAVMEKEAVSCVEMPKESTEPEKPAAAEVAVNGHETQAINLKETEEVVVTEAVKLSEEKTGVEIEVNLPGEESKMESTEKDDSSEKASGPTADNMDPEQPPGAVPEPVHVQTPLADSAPEPEPEKSVQSAPESQQPTSREESAPVMSEAELQPKSPTAVKVVDEGANNEGVKSEKSDPEPEEEPVSAAGSLSFAFLEQEKTKETLRLSRTIVILRGLPGSGKSFLSRAIADVYQDQCSVICADEHGVKPESPESSVDAYKALDEAVVACCGAATSSPLLMVVDDTNHSLDRLARLAEIAEQHHCVTLFLEPRTEWSRDAAQLSKKTKRGLAEAQIEVMKGQLEGTSLPLFFGWFLLSPAKEKICCTSMDFLKTLDTLEAFKKHLNDFTQGADKEVDLEQYFKSKGPLHCTTKFCNYGKEDGAKEYAQNPLLLWPADAEKEVEGASSLPLGSRAHVTLGCAEGVEPVQTGLDLLEILAVQQGGQKGELVEEMELGSLSYYGEGRWLLSLREPIRTPACFSSVYGPREVVPTKKEGEKKKKLKCSIL